MPEQRKSTIFVNKDVKITVWYFVIDAILINLSDFFSSNKLITFNLVDCCIKMSLCDVILVNQSFYLNVKCSDWFAIVSCCVYLIVKSICQFNLIRNQEILPVIIKQFLKAAKNLLQPHYNFDRDFPPPWYLSLYYAMLSSKKKCEFLETFDVFLTGNQI